MALLWHFIDGYRSAHETCPVAFYKALAETCQISGPFLSRGIIRPDLSIINGAGWSFDLLLTEADRIAAESGAA